MFGDSAQSNYNPTTCWKSLIRYNFLQFFHWSFHFDLWFTLTRCQLCISFTQTFSVHYWLWNCKGWLEVTMFHFKQDPSPSDVNLLQICYISTLPPQPLNLSPLQLACTPTCEITMSVHQLQLLPSKKFKQSKQLKGGTFEWHTSCPSHLVVSLRLLVKAV